jgi:hypothetical protein
MKTPSGDPGVASVQTHLSEIRVAQDFCAADSTIPARQHPSAEPETPSFWKPAAILPSYADPVWQQPLEDFYLRLPPQKLVSTVQGVAAEVTPPALPARRLSFIKAILQPLVDDAAGVSPLRSARRIAHLPECSSPDLEVLEPDDDAAQTLPPGWGVRRKSEGRPSFDNQNTRQNTWINPRRPPPHISSSYTRSDAGSQERPSGSLPSNANLRITGRLL